MAVVSPQALRRCGLGARRPNIVVITADDMRFDHLDFMPQTRALFADGTEFLSCRQNVSLCQPSRIGFLTGQYACRHGVYNNGQYMPNEMNAIGPWLQATDYVTAVIGKYPVPWGGGQVPGWSHRRTFTTATEQSAYGFKVFDGTTVFEPGGYQTDYIFQEAQAFVSGAAKPWFCWLTPSSPHVSFDFALEPRPEDLDDWLEVEWQVPPENQTGKPSWMQALPPVDATGAAFLREAARGQLQELRAVDDGIAALFATLEVSGQLSNTVVMFTSDNGVMYGEQRVWNWIPSTKNLPYEASMHVPLLVRGPGFAPTTEVAPVCGQDLTATCLALSGGTPTAPTDGIDLRAVDPDRAVLHERTTAVNPVPGMPAGAGVTTATAKLWRHNAPDPDRYEMYLLDSDPDELVNVAYDPAFADQRNALEARLDALLAGAPG
jgi:arylsulfatase A-like enzyme